MVIVQMARRLWVWVPIIYRCSNIFIIHLNIRFSLIENLRFYIRMRLSTRCSRFIMSCTCRRVSESEAVLASGIRHYLTTFSFGNCKIWFSGLKMTCGRYSCCHCCDHCLYYSSEASHLIGVSTQLNRTNIRQAGDPLVWKRIPELDSPYWWGWQG